MRVSLLPALAVCWATIATAVYTGQFQDKNWVLDGEIVDKSQLAQFTVALNLQNVQELEKDFLEVSMPTSERYGKFYSLTDLEVKYGASTTAKSEVLQYLKSIPGAKVEHGQGDLMIVKAPVGAIEKHFSTSLAWHKHSKSPIDKRGLRATSALAIPADIQKHISFLSLNSPITHVVPDASTTLEKQAKVGQLSAAAAVSAKGGNKEAVVTFTPVCGDGSVNRVNPPCSNLGSSQIPSFSVSVTAHPNEKSSVTTLTTDPMLFSVEAAAVFCYNRNTGSACLASDPADSSCVCTAKISPLPMYTQLEFAVSYSFPGSEAAAVSLGKSPKYALTDVATADFLSELYNIPSGLTVQHGSNQSVAEFYYQFYSNSDLSAFLAYSGVPDAFIPPENVYGDLPNDQSDPGGEAQLDIEYIMALARNASTFFYSYSDTNPYSFDNEGFLSYLYTVGNQSYPPLVHSLSYGDIEGEIFDTSNPGSVSYGERCDQEFIKMGLRGLTVLFASGDDGVADTPVRDDAIAACVKSSPSWPASSPYVTAVGGTQLTDKYSPICGLQYTDSFDSNPVSNQLNVQCTGTRETTCSSTIGGIITSGGGFSNIAPRPVWQSAAVEAYLAQSAYLPPASAGYFNPAGRAYPDISAYASNYFIYLDGMITRESGTSASTPVFAAMVTLWNDMRLGRGAAPMGFIAPFLYHVHAKSPESFNDITTGDNACGAGNSIDTVNCCEYSFAAAPGWDAATGLGSPNFDRIARYVVNTAHSVSPSANSGSGSSSEGTSFMEAPIKVTISDNFTSAMAVYAAIMSTVFVVMYAYNNFIKPAPLVPVQYVYGGYPDSKLPMMA